MKRLSVLCVVMLLCIGLLAGCASEEPPVSSDSSSSGTILPASDLPAESGNISDGRPTVYMTADISAEGLVAIYEALGASPSGNIE